MERVVQIIDQAVNNWRTLQCRAGGVLGGFLAFRVLHLKACMYTRFLLRSYRKYRSRSKLQICYGLFAGWLEAVGCVEAG